MGRPAFCAEPRSVHVAGRSDGEGDGRKAGVVGWTRELVLFLPDVTLHHLMRVKPGASKPFVPLLGCGPCAHQVQESSIGPANFGRIIHIHVRIGPMGRRWTGRPVPLFGAFSEPETGAKMTGVASTDEWSRVGSSHPCWV